MVVSTCDRPLFDRHVRGGLLRGLLVSTLPLVSLFACGDDPLACPDDSACPAFHRCTAGMCVLLGPGSGATDAGSADSAPGRDAGDREEPPPACEARDAIDLGVYARRGVFELLGVGPDLVLVYADAIVGDVAVLPIGPNGDATGPRRSISGVPSTLDAIETSTGAAIALSSGALRVVFLAGLEPAREIIVSSAGNAVSPSMAERDDGELGIVWMEGSGSITSVYFASIDSAGEVSSPRRLSDEGIGRPYLTWSGAYVVAYYTAGGPVTQIVDEDDSSGPGPSVPAPAGSVHALGAVPGGLMIGTSFGTNTVVAVSRGERFETTVSVPFGIGGGTAGASEFEIDGSVVLVARWASGGGASLADGAWLTAAGALRSVTIPSPAPHEVSHIDVGRRGPQWAIAWAPLLLERSPISFRPVCP